MQRSAFSCALAPACACKSRMSNLVSGTRTKESASKWRILNCAIEIHLAYIISSDHHPQSQSSKSQLAALQLLPVGSPPPPTAHPHPFSICLISRVVCGSRGMNGLGMSKCKNPWDLRCPQTELDCNPERFS